MLDGLFQMLEIILCEHDWMDALQHGVSSVLMNIFLQHPLVRCTTGLSGAGEFDFAA